MVNSELLNRKDPLTGFHTKEGLNEYLSAKTTAVYEKIPRLTVVLIDLDKFKDINDRHGHLVGDDALRHFAMVINKALQGRHFVARYGGDEFIIVIMDAPDGKESMDVAQRFQHILRKERFFTTRSHIQIKSSVGMASFPQDAKTARALMEAADEALYYAKKHGRNRIVRTQSLKKHFFNDQLIFISRIIVVLFFILAVLLSYRETSSLRGMTFYFQDVSQYIRFMLHAKARKRNYCYLSLKNGRKIEGWVVEENPAEITVAFKRPALRFGGRPGSEAKSAPSVVIPREEIAAFIQIWQK